MGKAAVNAGGSVRRVAHRLARVLAHGFKADVGAEQAAAGQEAEEGPRAGDVGADRSPVVAPIRADQPGLELL